MIVPARGTPSACMPLGSWARARGSGWWHRNDVGRPAELRDTLAHRRAGTSVGRWRRAMGWQEFQGGLPVGAVRRRPMWRTPAAAIIATTCHWLPAPPQIARFMVAAVCAARVGAGCAHVVRTHLGGDLGCWRAGTTVFGDACRPHCNTPWDRRRGMARHPSRARTMRHTYPYQPVQHSHTTAVWCGTAAPPSSHARTS